MSLYSLDLREKVIDFIKQGHTQTEATKVFGIGRTTIYRWLVKVSRGENLKPLSNSIRKPKKINPDDLLKYSEEHMGQTLKEIAEFFGVAHSSVWYRLKKLGFVCKKNDAVLGARRQKAHRIS